MLHTETVSEKTFQLLIKLEKEAPLSRFSLAGETALSLYLGHRKSIDLDLFSPFPFNVSELKSFLEAKYDFRADFWAKNTLKGSIDGVKTDFITHAYELLAPPRVEQDVRLYDLQDIIAMKISAITDNGSRVKDFIDIAFLSTRFSLISMLKCYEHKFPDNNIIIPLKAITFFDDIDFEEDIVMLNGRYDWHTIEKRLLAMTKHQEQVFDTPPVI